MHLPFSRFFVSCRNLSPSVVLFNQPMLLELTVYVAVFHELHYNSNHRWLFSIPRITSDARRITKLILYHWKSRRVVLYRCFTTATLSLNNSSSRCFALLSAFLYLHVCTMWVLKLSLSLAKPCSTILTICRWIWDAIETWDLSKIWSFHR